MNKKLGALLLAMLMIVSVLSGCAGSGGQETTAPNTPKETTGGNQPVETTEGEQVREFEYFASLGDPYTETSPIYDALRKATGIDIQFTWTSKDAFDTLLTSRIADKDLPDVIGGYTGTLIQELIDKGQIIPLTDLLEEKMPNYTRWLSEEDYQYLINSNDGEIYSFGYMVDFPGQVSWMVRQDWLDELNLPVPETWNEWVATWRAFKENDLNGNGEQDEIPLLIQYNYFYYYMNMYGIESGGTYSIVDGQLVYDCEHPLYLEWMEAMRGLYQEGLIPQDFISIDNKARKALLGANRVGSMCYDAVAASEIGALLAEIDENAFFTCVSPVKSPYGEQVIRERRGVMANTWITKAAVEEGKLDAILEFFNYVFSDEGIQLTNYGFEGETYELVNGEPKLLEPYCIDFSVARAYGLIPSTIPFYFSQDVYLSIMFKGQSIDSLDKYSQQAVAGLTTANEAYFYGIPPTITTEASVEYADLVTEQKSLRDRYIMGQITMDEYKKEYQALKDAGLDEVMKEANDAYQKMMGSQK